MSQLRGVVNSTLAFLPGSSLVQALVRETILNFYSFLDDFHDILKAKKGLGRGWTRGLDPVCSVRTGQIHQIKH